MGDPSFGEEKAEGLWLVRRSTEMFDLGRPFQTGGMYWCIGPAAGKGRPSIEAERV